MIEARDLHYTYQKGTPWERDALRGLDLRIEKGAFVGVCGACASGKTTLLRLLAGLVEPTSGSLTVEGRTAIAFQFPESQLFEATVLGDVMFGPLNLGLSREEARARAVEALDLVGLGSEFHDLSPFSLSGGEQRRAALAGVLAMESEVLLLDEPTAGLDPVGRKALLGLLMSLNAKGTTIVMASHSSQDIIDCCSEVLLLDSGSLVDSGRPEEVFGRHGGLEPSSLRLKRALDRILSEV